MADRSRPNDTTDEATPDRETTDERPDRGDRLDPETAAALRAVADEIDAVAETLPFAPARHHARQAAAAARETADPENGLVARRIAVGDLVTELRTAADEAEATRSQYRLLEVLYEEALPATRAAGTALYG